MWPGAGVQAALLDQRGFLFPWVPVFLAIGIGIYFTLWFEPGAEVYQLIGFAALPAVFLAARRGPVLAPVIWAVVLIGSGFLLAGARAHLVADPVLGWRYYGPVEGRIVGVDRSSSDAIRVTLDSVILRDLASDKTPSRVRVALHGDYDERALSPGTTVMMTAHMAPPSGPVEPGGFDFQRHAWFQRLGAVGYTRSPMLRLEPPDGGLAVFRWRQALSQRVQSGLTGEAGAFAAAIMTGDRTGIGQPTLEALRASNLAHLLAISGLHMGLLAGFVFATFRWAFAAVPSVGLRVPAKKLAALMALAVAAGYLALSGGNIATERAFVMVAVALLAVVVDRQVFSLRAVAVAAVIVLLLRPEALLGPGFQMSFAATTALIAVFGMIRDRDLSLGPVWLRPAVAVAISSAVAGAATGPVGAAHFNQIAHFGLAANLLSVPLMGALVMPAAVLAAVLTPLGLDWVALWIMGWGLRWILAVAHWVSDLENATSGVVGPGPWVLPVMALGFLIVILWQGKLRFVGLVPVAISLAMWAVTERPDVLIADGGALVGVMTSEGRALSKPRGAGFVAQNWLENDGDAETQKGAAMRWRPEIVQTVLPIRHLSGKRAAKTLRHCDSKEWIVLNTKAPDLPCRLFDPEKLRETGALAVYLGTHGVQIVSARQITGARLWNTQ